MRRILRWVVSVMRFVGTVNKSITANSVLKQLVDSAGSVGANFVEARAGRSRREFTSSVGISAKECREILYWLMVLRETGIVTPEEMMKIFQEGEELAKILTTIAKHAKINS